MPQSIDLRVLTSDELSIAVAPDLGGRIVELTDLSNGRQWLWRNHRVPFGPVASGSVYDDVWQGGFEELFPSDAPAVIGETSYPDHGELWSAPWQVMRSHDDAIELAVEGPATGVRIVKRLSIEGAGLTIRYSLEHGGRAALPHLFKLHPAIDVNEHCRIDLPGGVVEKVDSQFGNLLDGIDEQAWPTGVDLSRCRDKGSNTNEFVYVSDLPEGWCGITDTKARSWLRIDYPTDVFPYCWIFMTYGGWREHNVVVLEPCTNYPKDLELAISNGTAAILDRARIKEFEVTVSVGAVHE
jgi:hypothetical protein